MTSIHQATPSQLAEHIAHAARQRRLGARIAALPQVRPATPPPEVVALPKPHFWFSILDEVEPIAERQITCADIKRAVASHFDISVRDLISARRTANLVLPRHIGMYLAREMTLLSFPQIGRQFNREHCAVLYAINKISALLNESEVAEAMEKLRIDLRAAS